MRQCFRWIAVLVFAITVVGAAQAEDVDLVAQVRQHAGAHHVLILGEMHGTREIPGFVRALAESYAAEGAPLQLALELPTTENARLSTYLQSTGDAEARAALLDSPYWAVKTHLHDGRRSRDMLGLIEAMRVLRSQGRAVQVFGFDPPAESLKGAGARDAAMASHLRERRAALAPDAYMLVLTGNVHGMRNKPGFVAWPPMASLLRGTDFYNVRIDAQTGEFWGCVQHRRCGTRPLVEYDGPAISVSTDEDRSYDLWIRLPRFTVARLLDGSSDDGLAW